MQTDKFIEIIRDIKELVDNGHAREARHRLLAIRISTIPRTFRCQLALLARLSGLPYLSVRLLNPIVRPPPKAPCDATEEETAEYAASLVRIGASSEALSLLEPLDDKKTPEKLLYEAFALITQWDYSKTIPILAKYVISKPSDDMRHFIGMVNLASAYVHERIRPEATEILEKLRAETFQLGYLKLYGNVLELSAQDAVFHQQWEKAEKYLNQAHETLKNSGGLDAFYVEKWKAILQLSTADKNDKSALKQLIDIRNQAIQLSHWETIRDCDFHLALLTRDQSLLLRLYFGTPYESFRKRIFAEFGKPIDVPASYLWTESGHSPQVVLDLRSGNLRGSKVAMKPGQILHRLLSALSTDFYRPFRLATVHAMIYPGDFFNPVSSPGRIHVNMNRLRAWLSGHCLPLTVIEYRGTYRISIKEGGAILISEEKVRKHQDALVKQLRYKVAGESFTSKEASSILGVSARTINRLIKEATESGDVQKLGASSTTRYRFAS